MQPLPAHGCLWGEEVVERCLNVSGHVGRGESMEQSGLRLIVCCLEQVVSQRFWITGSASGAGIDGCCSSTSTTSPSSTAGGRDQQAVRKTAGETSASLSGKRRPLSNGEANLIVFLSHRRSPRPLLSRYPAIQGRPGCITATAGCCNVSIRYTERLAEAGIEPSVGSVGQCPGRNHQRPVQGRGDSPAVVEKPRGSGAGHAGLGGLVQPPAAAGADRQRTSGRGQSGLLSTTRQLDNSTSPLWWCE